MTPEQQAHDPMLLTMRTLYRGAKACFNFELDPVLGRKNRRRAFHLIKAFAKGQPRAKLELTGSGFYPSPEEVAGHVTQIHKQLQRLTSRLHFNPFASTGRCHHGQQYEGLKAALDELLETATADEHLRESIRHNFIKWYNAPATHTIYRDRLKARAGVLYDFAVNDEKSAPLKSFLDTGHWVFG